MSSCSSGVPRVLVHLETSLHETSSEERSAEKRCARLRRRCPKQQQNVSPRNQARTRGYIRQSERTEGFAPNILLSRVNATRRTEDEICIREIHDFTGTVNTLHSGEFPSKSKIHSWSG